MGRRVGVLALQGDFRAHLAALRREGFEGVEVRYREELDALDGIILPGGESSTHLRLLEERGLADALRTHRSRGGAIFGTCAGAILIARRVTNPEQASLDFIDIDVQRNAYGRQKESFETRGPAPGLGGPPLHMVFIRAPRITRAGPGVEILASFDGAPVLVRQGNVLAGTFHPELADDGRVHGLFASMTGLPVLTAS